MFGWFWMPLLSNIRRQNVIKNFKVLLAKLIKDIILIIPRSKALKVDIVKPKIRIIIYYNEEASEVATHY